MRKPQFLAAFKAEMQTELDVRRSLYPHEAKQRGMLRSIMGDDAFFTAKDDRRRWIEEMGYGPYFFDEFFDEEGKEVGRSYRFTDPAHAFHFRMRF